MGGRADVRSRKRWLTRPPHPSSTVRWSLVWLSCMRRSVVKYGEDNIQMKWSMAYLTIVNRSEVMFVMVLYGIVLYSVSEQRNIPIEQS